MTFIPNLGGGYSSWSFRSERSTITNRYGSFGTGDEHYGQHVLVLDEDE
jgi:hypothetical protein